MSKNVNFDDVIVDGLSSVKTYVRLSESPRRGVQLVWRPFLGRHNPNVVWFGGKLSAFYRPNETAKKANAGKNPMDLMKAAYKIPSVFKANVDRIGTHFSVPFLASVNDGKVFADKLASKIIPKVLDSIEEALKVEIKDRKKVTAALRWQYAPEVEILFDSNSGHGTSEFGRNFAKAGPIAFGNVGIYGSTNGINGLNELVQKMQPTKRVKKIGASARATA